MLSTEKDSTHWIQIYINIGLSIWPSSNYDQEHMFSLNSKKKKKKGYKLHMMSRNFLSIALSQRRVCPYITLLFI